MTDEPVILAFDTALSGCAVALCDSMGACVKESRPMARGQAEELVPMIQDVLIRSGHSFADIGVIVTTTGPGAFTGLRIGLAAARALGLALGKPVLGVTTTEALARQYLADNDPVDGETVCVLLETKRRDFYFHLFDSGGRAIGSPQAGEKEVVGSLLRGKKAVLIGDALDRFQNSDDDKNWRYERGYELIDPEVVAAIGADRYRVLGKADLLSMPEPLYLRPADVSSPKRKQRQVIG